MLSQALRALHDSPREVDPWYCRAFPECRLGRHAALAEGADSKLRQIAQRANEAGCRDHVVDLERQRSPVARTLRLDTIALSSAFDTLDRRIENDNAAGQRPILIGLHIASANTHQRSCLDPQLRTARREELDLPRHAHPAPRPPQ